MINSNLHEFDLELCDYVCGTFGGHMLHDSGDGLEFRRWMAGELDPVLFEYIRSSRESRLLLNPDELQNLEMAVTSPPPSALREWVPWRPTHQRYVNSLPEIREALSKATADDFASVSLRIAGRLEPERLELEIGLELVTGWIETVRRLKQALGLMEMLPRPEGTFPTPTCPFHQHEQSMPSPNNQRAGVELALDLPPVNKMPAVGFGDDMVLSPVGAGEILKVSAKHVIRLIESGKLPAVNVGRGKLKPRYRIQRTSVESLLAGGPISVTSCDPSPPPKPAVLDGLLDHFV